MITGIIFIVVGMVGHYHCKRKIDKVAVPSAILKWGEVLIPFVFIILGLFTFVYCLLP